MSSVIWHTMMSLDGFIAGPNDAMQWAFDYGERSPLADETRDSIGAILAGRRWYDVASVRYDGVDGIYGGRWKGPVFVITHRIADVPDDPTVTFLGKRLPEAIEIAREAASGKAVGIFGASVARQCLEHGLIDEIVIHIGPVLLGSGVRLHGQPGATPIELERIDLGGTEGQQTDLRYRVVKREG
jgi:dihydrofolate reductase